MIVSEEFLSSLRRFFNLNLYEVRIWTALLSRGVSTAGELSDIGNVPRSRAYDILESLEKKGFVIMKLGKPIKYVAVEPKEVVERVKKHINIGARANIKKLEDLKGSDVLNELDNLHTQGIEFIEPTDLSGAIRGRHNVYTHMETMVKNAKSSVTIFTTSKGVIRKIDALKTELEKLNKKGVKIRIAAPFNKDSSKILKNASRFAELKDSKNMDARFVIVDNKEVMFMIMHDSDVHPTYDIGIWISAPYFANALSGLFDNTWKGMSNVKF